MTSNPLDDLRKINREQREAATPSVDTDIRETVSTAVRQPAHTVNRPSVSTDARTEGRKHGRKAVSKDGLTEGSTEARTDALKEGLKDGRTGGRTGGRTEGGADGRKDLRETVLTGIEQKRTYQGGVKATIEISPELSTRFKRFGIDHNNVSLRQTMIELLDAFLTGEGY